MKKNLLTICILFIGVYLLSGCSEYLELKPDAKMAIPKTVQDCELLLNDYGTFNNVYPYVGEIASDNYFMNSSDWEVINEIDDKNAYIWLDIPAVLSKQWQMPYKVVFSANLIMEVLDKINTPSQEDWGVCYGTALFFRAFAFHQLLDVFTEVYQPNNAASTLGIPLRLSSNMEQSLPRASLEKSYDQTISDYKKAITLLPTMVQSKGLPAKASAYAGLARLLLSMQNYEEAYKYADSALMLNSQLLDYEQMNADLENPFVPFNKEVLFSASSTYTSVLSEGYAKIDMELHDAYEDGDLRKKLFFRENGSDQVFRGSYNGNPVGIFVGLTTAEMFLVKAECAVRLGNFDSAKATLNQLLKKRWRSTSFQEVSENDATKLLEIVLWERRKELLFRGQRWPDLKRLNLDAQFSKTLTRTVKNSVYELFPNDKKYAIMLPLAAVREGQLVQNSRN